MSNQLPSQPVSQAPQYTGPSASSFGAIDAWKYNPDYYKMADFLGIKHEDKVDDEVARKVLYLKEFTGSSNAVDAMYKIRSMIHQMGISSKGKDALIQVYRYARLQQDKMSIEKEMGLYKQANTRSVQPQKPKQPTSSKSIISNKAIDKTVSKQIGGISKIIQSSVQRQVQSTIQSSIKNAVNSMFSK